MSGSFKALGIVLSLVILAGLAGCVRGDRLVRQSHSAYNEAIRARLDEELLLNLVRLRYRDRPLFLQVSSVITRFVRQGSFSVGAGAGLDNSSPSSPDSLDAQGSVGGGYSYSEQPTVTFTPLQGEDFSERLLRPIDLETLALLQRSGWSIERVLRLTVQQMNGLDNASGASGPTPAKAPEFRRFIEASQALRELQMARAVVLGAETGVSSVGVDLPAASLTPADALAAAQAGYVFERVGDGETVALRQTSTRFVLRIGAAHQDSPSTQRLRQVLGLRPIERTYEVMSAVGSVEDILGVEGERTRIVLVTRSLLGVLFFLCHAIEMPAVDEERGVVTVTVDEEGNPFDWSEVTEGLLRIRSSDDRPDGAAIAVTYRGHWFYISDDDLVSKSTFALLAQLYALQAGAPVAGGAPVPTIPIGG